MSPLRLPLAAVGAAIILEFTGDAAWAQLRTFKDTAGRETSASIESVAGDSVDLMTASGKVYTVPIERFAAEDRAFIRDWAEENPASAAVGFLRYSVKSDRRKIPNPGGPENEKFAKVADSSTAFDITIENPTRETVPAMKMDYVIYKRVYERTDGKRTRFEIVETKKEMALGALAPGEKRQIMTETVLALTRVQNADREKGTPEVKLSETVLGIVVDFFVKERKVRTVPYPENMLVKMREEEERDQRKELEARARRSGGGLPDREEATRAPVPDSAPARD